jgi:hypothetical protein
VENKLKAAQALDSSVKRINVRIAAPQLADAQEDREVSPAFFAARHSCRQLSSFWKAPDLSVIVTRFMPSLLPEIDDVFCSITVILPSRKGKRNHGGRCSGHCQS